MPSRRIMPANARGFQESITSELETIKDRVRFLIGSRHWGEEGRFKEAILKNIIKKFIPNNISVGTGFIVGSDKENDVSRQLDIILYDNTCPVLFSEGDFIITTKKNVKGIIEVKSRITPASLSQVVQQFEESVNMLGLLPSFIPNFAIRPKIRQYKIFLGVFAYEFDGQVDSQRLDEGLRRSSGIINHLALGSDLFIRKWKKEDGQMLEPRIDAASDFYNIYELNHIAYSYFISNLIDVVSGGLNDRYWFSFPIAGTKEVHRIRTIFL